MTLLHPRRPVVVGWLFVVAATVAPFTAGIPVAAAASDGACPTAAGVTVVVDFQDLGGGVAVRCTDVAVDSGLQALHAAGIDFRTTVRFPGFVCRIADRPASDPCQTTSPTTAYWSYWTAARGGSWCYSSVGAGGRRPPEGTVEGWSFHWQRDPSSPSPVLAPRVAPPSWVAGAPRSIANGNCDTSVTPSTSPTTSTPTTTRPTAPPATTMAPRPAGQGGSPTLPAAAGQPSTAGGPRLDLPDVAAPPSSTAPGAQAAGSTSPAEVAGETAVAAGAEEAAADQIGTAAGPPSGAGTDDVAVGQHKDGQHTDAVDLAPRHATTSPVGVLAALVLVTALGATSAVVNRRVRREARPDP